MKTKNKALFILFFVTILWGGGYIASKFALEYGWSTYSILFVRNMIGFIVTFLLSIKTKFWKNRKIWLLSIITGAVYFAGFAFQLSGQKVTSIQNAALLSDAGLLLVPAVSLFFGKKTKGVVLFGCVVGLCGGFILSYQPGFKFHTGDILVTIGAIFYALHIVLIDKILQNDDIGFFPSICIQYLTMSLLSGLFIPITGSSVIGDNKGIWGVLYYAIASGVIGLILQIWCQKHLEPAKVGLVLSLEGLFAVIFGIIFYKETITTQTIVGGSIMIIAILLVQYFETKEQVKLEEKENEKNKSTIKDSNS